MFFECRVNVPDCSPLFEDAKNAFLKGEVVQARNLVLEMHKKGQWNIPEDALLCGDISRACGNHLQFYATIKIAFKKWPESRLLKIAWAIALSGRFYTLRALSLLEELFAESTNEEKALIASDFAATYARGGFQTSAATWMEKSLDIDQGNDPKFYYNLAYAAYCNRDWEKSLLFANKALQLAPFWSRLRAFLADILLANGELRKAQQLMEEGIREGYRDASNEFLLGLQSFTTGNMEEASHLFRQFHNDWSFAKDFTKQSRTLLAYSLWNCGKYQEATEVALTSGIKNLVEQFSSCSSSNEDRKIIPTPLISQEPYLCVPTSVTMVASTQGVELNPRDLYTQMRGRGGTFTWRMAEEMTRRGFQVQYIKSTPQAIRGMLDDGIPLIGELEGVLNSHVEVICGYDNALKIFYVRDPAHWSIVILPFNELENRYAMSGHFLIALISPSKQKSVNIKPEWLSQTGQSLIQFHAAWVQGKIEEANQIKSSIPEKGIAVYKYAVTGRGITHTPQESQQITERFAHDAQAPLVGRIQALLQLATPDRIDELLELIKQQQEQFGWWTREYFQLLSYFHKGLWPQVLNHSEKLLDRHCAFDLLWTYRATAFLELGKPNLAQEMLAKALDISPESREIQDRIRFVNRRIVPFREKEDELKQAMKDFPDHHQLKEDYAILLLESDRGLEYEKWELEYQKYFPKMPQSYQRLAGWYLNQGRKSLARNTLEKGRKLIGLKELPYFDFEEEFSKVANAGSETGEDKASLLKLANRAIDREEFQHPDELECIQKLHALHDEGKLTWYEYNQLLSLRLVGIMKAHHFANNLKVKKSITDILPDKLPGTPLLTLDHLLEQCHFEKFSRLAAVALLEWCLRICGDQELSPTLRFSIGFLKELCNDLKKAENDHQNLLKDFPLYYIPQYRLGEILFQRGDWEEAIKAHQIAVSLRPGLQGSLNRLADLHHHFGNIDAALFYRRKLCQCLPHNFDDLGRLLNATLQNKGWQQALNELETNHQHHEAEALNIFKTRIFLDGGELDQAKQISEFSPQIPELQRYHCVSQLDIALALKDYARADRIIQESLEKWPQDGYLHQQKAKRLAQDHPDQARAYLKDLLCRGVADPILALMHLETSNQRRQDAIKIIETAEASHKNILAESFAYCFRQPQWSSEKIDFLSWVNQNLPHLPHLREELAVNLWLRYRDRAAVQIATSLHEEDPENPHWLALLAKCYEYDNPEKALQYLEQAYEYTGAAEYLAQMANCYFNLGQKDTAKTYYWQALDRYPYSTDALIHLFSLAEKNEKLKQLFFRALEKGYGVDAEMFHLAAIELANYFKTTVPQNWIDFAIRRYEMVTQQGSGNPEEEERLEKAIFTWHRAKGKESEARKYKPGLWTRLRLFNWPGKAWIPNV